MATSYTNTPQAGDDSYQYNEDWFGTGSILLDVLSNDLGGNAKKLYSIDDGTGALSELLTRDPGLVTAWETTADGNQIRINAGKIEFQFKAGFDINCLNAGQEYTDTFVYAIQMANGTLSWATVSIHVTGANDLASITGAATAGVTEDASLLTTGGQLVVQDVDAGQCAFQAVAAADLVKSCGSFAFDADTGTWSYTLNNGANGVGGTVQSLRAGEKVYDTLTVTSLDGTATQQIRVEVTGANDAAVITGTATGALSEDGATLTAGGTLSVSDVDSGESAFAAPAASALAGSYGSFTFDAATGTWDYTLANGSSAVQSLRGGQLVHDSLTIASVDGTTQQIQVGITGANDAAVITGTASGALAEDGATLAAGGTLSVSDVDTDESAFAAPAASALAGTYGSFSFDAATGAWSYTLANGSSAVQSLRGGQLVHDSLTIASIDGTSQQIQVDITGANDAAVITGTATGALGEDGATLTACGTLSVSDVDTGESAFAAPAAGALAGTYGSFSFDAATGAWDYTLANGSSAVQSLFGGQAVQDTLTVASIDGTTQQIQVDITGANDAATITGPATGDLTEDGASLSAGGTLSVSDVDTGESAFAAPAAAALVGSYGSFTFDTATGAWTYTLANGSSAVQSLNTGDTVYDALAVSSVDGTSQTIQVAIHGASDVPAYVLSAEPVTTNTITGGNGADTLNGTAGNDLIQGFNQGDTLNGGAGDDVIKAGTGGDFITGGLGRDHLFGEQGADKFLYTDAAEGGDVIRDFLVGTDKLQFSGAITSGGAGYSLVLVDTNGDHTADATLLQVDSNGAAAGGTVTDMCVLVGVTSLTAADILWS